MISPFSWIAIPALLAATKTTHAPPSAAILVSQVSDTRLKSRLEKLVAFETRAGHGETASPTRGIGAARNWLKKEFESLSPTLSVFVHEFEMTNRFTNSPAPTQQNVVALLPGRTFPKKVIVVGAHYDSINLGDRKGDGAPPAPGANDNGSGTVGVLEAATIFAPVPSNISLMFVCFAGEEHGLKGSAAFAAYLKEAGYEVVAMINNDIIGGVNDATEGRNEDSVRCFGDPSHSPSAQLMRWAKITGEPFVRPFRIEPQPAIDRPRRGGDHIPFTRANHPAIRLVERFENLEHQHTPTDTVDHVQFMYLKKVVQINIALISALIQAPRTPQGLAAERRGSRVVLTWQPVEGAVKYLIGRREPGMAAYSELREVETPSWSVEQGPALYGVASVDAKGRLSLFSSEISGE